MVSVGGVAEVAERVREAAPGTRLIRFELLKQPG